MIHSPLGLAVHAPARSYAQKIGRGRCAAVRCDLSSDERERGRTVLRDLVLSHAPQTHVRAVPPLQPHRRAGQPTALSPPRAVLAGLEGIAAPPPSASARSEESRGGVW